MVLKLLTELRVVQFGLESYKLVIIKTKPNQTPVEFVNHSYWTQFNYHFLIVIPPAYPCFFHVCPCSPFIIQQSYQF